MEEIIQQLREMNTKLDVLIELYAKKHHLPLWISEEEAAAIFGMKPRTFRNKVFSLGPYLDHPPLQVAYTNFGGPYRYYLPDIELNMVRSSSLEPVVAQRLTEEIKLKYDPQYCLVKRGRRQRED